VAVAVEEEKTAQESRNAGIQERKRQKEYKEKKAEDGPQSGS
jgi:hypothetical protein